MVMSSLYHLLTLTNYRELPGFKANVVFNSVFNSTFGFNVNEQLLCSIVDKALALIDTERISGQWIRRTYDYRIKLAQAQRPWMILSVAALLLLMLILTVLHMKNKEKRKTVADRKAVEENLKYAHKLSDALAYITRSPTISAGILKSAADIIVREGCIALNVSRIGTWTKPKDRNVLVGVSCYNISTGEHTVQEDFDLSCSKEYIKRFETERLIVTNNVNIFDMPADTVHMHNPDACAIIDVPIYIDGILAGAICIEQDSNDSFPVERKWTIEEQNFSSSLADIMALAVSGAGRLAAREVAETASRAKTAFLANMSHEMRTPMNVVVGLTDLMLEEESVPANIKDNLKKISTAGSTLLGLINDVLDISKIEAGRMELTPIKYEVPSFLNDIISLNVIRIAEKPVTFTLDISEDLFCYFYGDDLRVKQIINNLLSNAFKYTQKGTVTLGMSAERAGDDLWVSIYVSDTGIGIRAEDLEKLFRDYTQVDAHTNRLVEGTGLGLAISKRLAEMMDGAISAESEYNRGSVFRVRFRQGFVDDTTIGSVVTENLRGFRYAEDKQRDKKTLARADLSSARVLVVDDIQTNLDVASALLGKYKMKVDCVLSGYEALERIRLGEPVYNVIFMDHMMPGMDGLETAGAIRALGTDYARRVPIIALTANAVKGTEELFYEHGFQAFVSKPIDVMSLDAVVRKWIAESS
jgi:signal transduction histidine kinase